MIKKRWFNHQVSIIIFIPILSILSNGLKELGFIELLETRNKFKALEIVTLEMVLLWQSFGLGDLNSKRLVNGMPLYIWTKWEPKINSTNLQVLLQQVQEVLMQQSFTINQVKIHLWWSKKIWFISLIQEDNIWMERLMWRELSILELQHNKKKTLTLKFYLEI